ncbi:hypothetical protein JCM19239_1852 [Vibrio variabilis]|uniref:Uncharacterized protein n=1 Tax=Vibrio variabilis TaxID=990271 RepID=A0ABQ0J6L0_9VIBR|nr:hypothetical protein JCM19239_1852 [Vibrio variabilis]
MLITYNVGVELEILKRLGSNAEPVGGDVVQLEQFRVDVIEVGCVDCAAVVTCVKR